jgi:hypothetical protein
MLSIEGEAPTVLLAGNKFLGKGESGQCRITVGGKLHVTGNDFLSTGGACVELQSTTATVVIDGNNFSQTAGVSVEKVQAPASLRVFANQGSAIGVQEVPALSTAVFPEVGDVFTVTGTGLPQPTGELTHEVAGGTSQEVFTPVGTKEDDYLLMSVAVETTGVEWTPGDWKQLGATTVQGGVSWAYFYTFAKKDGQKLIPISWNKAATVAWTMVRVKNVDPTTPDAGHVLLAGAPSLTVKYGTVTPSDKPTLDYLLYEPDNNLTVAAPAGFTRDGVETALTAKGFYREYSSEAATGETSTTQTGSGDHFVTLRVMLNGQLSPEIKNIAASWPGRIIHLKFASAIKLLEGGNMKLSAYGGVTSEDTLTLFYDGANWVECGRSVN